MGFVGILITCIIVDYKILNTVNDKFFELAMVLQRNWTNTMEERNFMSVSISSSDPMLQRPTMLPARWRTRKIQ